MAERLTKIWLSNKDWSPSTSCSDGGYIDWLLLLYSEQKKKEKKKAKKTNGTYIVRILSKPFCIIWSEGRTPQKGHWRPGRKGLFKIAEDTRPLPKSWMNHCFCHYLASKLSKLEEGKKTLPKSNFLLTFPKYIFHDMNNRTSLLLAPLPYIVKYCFSSPLFYAIILLRCCCCSSGIVFGRIYTDMNSLWNTKASFEKWN